MFNEYLHEGYYPFFTGNREDYYINIENVVNLIIEQELPLLCGVDPAYTRKLKALMGILATSVPYELDITKLAGMIGLSRNSVINYLQNLDKAELLKLLYSDLLPTESQPIVRHSFRSRTDRDGKGNFCRQPVIRKS